MFADLYSTVTQDKLDLTQGLKNLQQKVAELSPKLTQGKLKLFLSGNDIMKLLNIKAGPQIGELIHALETAQLEGTVKTKEEAEEYIIKIRNQKPESIPKT